MADTTDSTLQDIYYNPKTGYCGALELYRRAKKRSTAITLKAVKEFLERQSVAQQFKGANRKKEHLSIEAERGHVADRPLFYEEVAPENKWRTLWNFCSSRDRVQVCVCMCDEEYPSECSHRGVRETAGGD